MNNTQLKDEYTITWCIEDVKEVAPDLTDEQCRQVLYLACERRHDAEIGVNWDVLKSWANEVRDGIE
jgi:hypothetical protein